MSNLGSESEVLDLETGKGSDPGTASASASASVERAVAAEDEDPELVIDPMKASQVNIAVVLFCVVAIGVLVWSVYAMYSGPVPFWEAFGLSAVYFIICTLSIGTVLLARKALISIWAAERPDATTSTASDSATSSPIKLLYLPGF